MNEQMNLLFEILEEIKQQNRDLMKSLSEKDSNTQPIDLTKWREELTEVAITLGQRLTEIREGQANFNTQQTEALNLLSERVTETATPPITKKYYLLDAKRWVQWAVWGVALLIVSVSLSVSIYIGNVNRELNDYALRYRILRMEHSADNEAIAHLDSIFVTHRSDTTINNLRQKVLSYEQAVQRQAELLLRQEALTKKQEELQQRLK